jgi:hypothetical protein
MCFFLLNIHNSYTGRVGKTQLVPAKVVGTYCCSCEVAASSCGERYKISNNIRKTRNKQEFGRFEFLTCYAVLGQLDLEGGGTTSRETTVTITSQHGATSQNTLIFVKTAVRTYNHSRIFRQAFVNVLFPRTVTLYKPGCDPTRILNKTLRHLNTVGTPVDTPELAAERKNMGS